MYVSRHLTVELLAYGGVVAAGLALRLAGLGQAPLEPSEAELALSAWQVTRGAPPALDGGPLPVFATTLVLFVFGASDAAARLLPALAGAALPLAAWALRGACGRWGALGAATALAVSPTLVAAGRRAEATALVLALAALVLASAALPGRPRWTATALVGGALAAGGTPGFLALTALALGGLWAVRREWRRARSRFWRPLPMGFAASFLVATGGLAVPSGWGLGVWQPYVTWLLGVGDPLPALRAYARELLLLDPAALALVGLAVLAAGRRLLAGPSAWLGGSALVVLALGAATATAPPAALAVVTAAALAAAGASLAAEIAAGVAALHAAALPEGQAGGPPWPALGLGLLGIGVGLWLAALVISSATLPGGPPRVFDTPITGYFALTLGLLALAAAVGFQALGAERTRLTALVAALAVASALALHGATWGVVLAVGGPETQAGMRSSSADLANLVDEVERHAAVWSTPGRRDVPLALDAAVELPLAWYLRAYEQRPARAEDARLVVQPAAAPRPAGRWAERRYRLGVSGRAPAPGDLWRWQLYRERPGPSEPVDVLLLVRLD